MHRSPVAANLSRSSPLAKLACSDTPWFVSDIFGGSVSSSDSEPSSPLSKTRLSAAPSATVSSAIRTEPLDRPDIVLVNNTSKRYLGRSGTLVKEIRARVSDDQVVSLTLRPGEVRVLARFPAAILLILEGLSSQRHTKQ